MELTIKNETYQFNFGMGFMREVNKLYQKPIDGVKDKTQNVGLQFLVASVLDGDVEALVEVLNAANIGEKPRVNKNTLDYYIDNECDDIEALFGEVLGFLKTANATKKVTMNLVEYVEKEKAKQAIQ